MKFIILRYLLFLTTIQGFGQSIYDRSNEYEFDFSDSKKEYNSSLPNIEWFAPENNITFLKEGKVKIEAQVSSLQVIESITLAIKNVKTGKYIGTTNIHFNKDLYTVKFTKDILLPDGVNELEILAENKEGIKAISKKRFHIGLTELADASSLNRTDYALIFAIDEYDNWNSLVNPIFDARSIQNELQQVYGFKTDLVENATQEQILSKLREYSEKRYEQLDQLFIFFAGHGFFDDSFGEGYVVTKESLPSDPGRTSYLPHSRISNIVNNNPCEHIFLVMDVCFGGTFDENIARRGMNADVYAAPSQAEIIKRKLQFKTRKYLTSGGKEYVSDGIAGKHSPFAKEFINALESHGNDDGILTISELLSYVETLKTAPKFGPFGADQLGSEFVFVVK